MSDRLVHRTWSVHTVSAFSSALHIGSALGSGKDPVSVSGQAKRPESEGRRQRQRRHTTIRAIEEDVTSILRRSIHGNGRSYDVGGTYVAMSWVDVGANTVAASPPAVVAAGPAGRKRSRPRAADGDQSGRRDLRQRHLHVQVQIRHESAAQILLCFPRAYSSVVEKAEKKDVKHAAGKRGRTGGATASATTAFATERTHIEIASLAYVLTHGSTRAYGPVLVAGGDSGLPSLSPSF